MTEEQAKKMHQLTKEIGKVAEVTHPLDFSPWLLALIANSIGALPDSYWRRMFENRFIPCSIPGCNCEVVGAQVMEALNNLREDPESL